MRAPCLVLAAVAQEEAQAGRRFGSGGRGPQHRDELRMRALVPAVRSLDEALRKRARERPAILAAPSRRIADGAADRLLGLAWIEPEAGPQVGERIVDRSGLRRRGRILDPAAERVALGDHCVE